MNNPGSHRPDTGTGHMITNTTVGSTNRIEDAARTAAKMLYRAEVHRQGVGWDAYCTALLVGAQHELAAALDERDT